MDVNVNLEIFQYDKDALLSEIPGVLYMDEERFKLFHDMWAGRYFDGVALDISKFLREDLSINLEQLEIAISLSVEYLEQNREFDSPIFLGITGIDKYYELRGITEMPRQQKEEYYFVRGFIKAVAENESSTKISVDYVTERKAKGFTDEYLEHKSKANSRGQ